MHLKPILLEAALTAIFGWLALTFWTGIEGYILLLYLCYSVFSTLYLLLNYFFEWAHLVATVRNVD